jgi:hypothetical protein
MTALCGGGSSGPKPALDAALTFSSGRLIQLLVKAGLSEFSVALPLVGTIPVVLTSFCSTDPPAMSALTDAEAKAVLGLQFGPDFFSGLGKLKDIILNLIWLDVCQCNSGALTSPAMPTTPSGAPVFVPPSLSPPPLTYGPWYPMLRSAVKVLSMGSGGARPSDWTTASFNDSAWGAPVSPAIGPFAWAQFGGYQLGSIVGSNAALPGNVEYCSPSSPLAHNYEQWIMRWRVYIGDVDNSFGVVRVSAVAQADGGWTSGAVHVNGHPITAPLAAVSANALVGWLIPNSWNVICFDIDPTAGVSTVNKWGTEGGIGFGLDFSTAAAPVHVTPCCPPDEVSQSYLDAILQMVTLIQRQAAPFSYIHGAVHAAISGDGEISVSSLLGVAIDITTLPSAYGRSEGTPVHLFDLGYVTLGTADGWLPSRRVDADGTLELRPGLAGPVTRVGYTLSPGVIADLTELVREP